MKLSSLPVTVAAVTSVLPPMAAAFKFQSSYETAHMIEECYRLAWLAGSAPPPRCHDLLQLGIAQVSLHAYHEGLHKCECPPADWDALRQDAAQLT